MTFKDFISQENFHFPILRCRVTKEVEDALEGPDKDMICDIRNMRKRPDFDDETTGGIAYELILDFSPYERYNNKLAIPSFYDKSGMPNLVWRESDYYNNGLISLIIMEHEHIDSFFCFDADIKITELSEDRIREIVREELHSFHKGVQEWLGQTLIK